MPEPTASTAPPPADDRAGPGGGPTGRPARSWSVRSWSARSWSARSWWRALAALAVAVGLAWLLDRPVGPGEPPRWARGDVEGLVPPADRAPTEEIYVVLRAGGDATAEDLHAAAQKLSELSSSFGPLAPPAGEVRAWADEHAFLLIPPQRHGELAERLRPAHMAATIDALRAALASPFFGALRPDARRDPLDLDALRARGELASPGWPSGAAPTNLGDLVSADGRRILVTYRGDTTLANLRADLRAAVSEKVEVALAGAAVREEAGATAVAAELPRRLLAIIAGLAAVLLVHWRHAGRALLTVAVGLACLESAVLVRGGTGLHDLLPLTVLLAATCQLAVAAPTQARRSWLGCAALWCVAWLPAALSQAPTPRSWTLAAVTVVAVLLAVTVLASRSFAGAPTPLLEGQRTAAPSRKAGAGALATLTVAILAAVAAVPAVRRAGPVAAAALPTLPTDDELVRDFFDPQRLVTLESRGASPAAALDRAAADARSLGTLVPDVADMVLSPGLLILPQREIDARRRTLVPLELGSKLSEARDLLESRGLRAEAFSEFLDAGVREERGPSAAAALEGPLGRWIERFLRGAGDESAIRSFVLLAADPKGPAVRDLVVEPGVTLELRGPALAEREARSGLAEWLAVRLCLGAWLFAAVAWFAARDLAIAVTAALAGLGANAAAFASLQPLDLPVSPATLGVLLWGSALSVSLTLGVRTQTWRRGLPAVFLHLAAAVGLAGSSLDAWRTAGVVGMVSVGLGALFGLAVAPALVGLWPRRTP